MADLIVNIRCNKPYPGTFEEPCDLYSYMFEHTGTLDVKEFNERVRALFTSNSIEDWEKANSYLENLEINIAVIELLCR